MVEEKLSDKYEVKVVSGVSPVPKSCVVGSSEEFSEDVSKQ